MMTRRKTEGQLTFEREGPYRVVGHIWSMEVQGVRRYLVRKHRWSGRSVTTELRLVQLELPLCLRCLSHDVFVTKGAWADLDGGRPGVDFTECSNCGLAFWIIPEPDE